MRPHAIEEANSEYSASFISVDGRPPHVGRKNTEPQQTVLEVDEVSENSGPQNKGQQRMHYKVKDDEMDSYYDPNEHAGREQQEEDQQSDESLKQPQIVRKKK